MKIKYVFLCLLSAISFAACDTISENERFEKIDLNVKKNVLIEDFTGQMCVNCPNMAAVIDTLQSDSLIGDRVIAVAIHGGSLSLSSKIGSIGLATEVGEYYQKQNGVNAWPNAKVDRNGSLVDEKKLAAKVLERINEPPYLAMDMENSFSESDSTVTVAVKLRGMNEEVAGKLQLWVIESGLVKLQYMPDGSTNYKYVHNHVFRDTIPGNGIDGENFELSGVEEKTVVHTFKLNKLWKAENVSVVAFTYNNSGVLQAVAKGILPKEEQAY